jgi:V-type H+-transporting ATPase 16kDa proteolipid subunit
MISAPEILTALGAAASVFLCSAGSALASIPAGVYAVKSSGYTSFAPIVISGVLAIYGLIVALLLSSKLGDAMDAGSGYKNITAGMCVGLACLSSGIGIGRFLEKTLKDAEYVPAVSTATNSVSVPLLEGNADTATASPKTVLAAPSIRFLMVLTYLEAIGLYGLIVALVLLW